MNDSRSINELQIQVHQLEAKIAFVMQHLNIDYRPATDPALDKVAELLRRGEKIEAIKVYRAATGAELKQAKEVVEQLERTLGIR